MTDLLCWLVVPAYDIALSYFGGFSLKPMVYLLLGLYNGVGLHPIAGHVISEHCMMANDGQVRRSCGRVHSRAATGWGRVAAGWGRGGMGTTGTSAKAQDAPDAAAAPFASCVLVPISLHAPLVRRRVRPAACCA